MTKVDGSLGSLIQGVSQQPSRARIPGQSQEQINVSNDEVFGMSRRQPTEIIGSMPTLGQDTSSKQEELFHWLSDGSNRTVLATMRTGPEPVLKLFEGGHTERTITYSGSSTAYLVGTHGDIGRRKIKLVEVDGRIVVVNTEMTVATLAGTPADMETEDTIVFCLGGQYNTGYQIKITTPTSYINVVYAAPDGDNVNESDNITEKYIVREIYRALINTVGNSTDLGAPSEDDDWIPSFNEVNGGTYITAGGSAAFLTDFDVYLVNETLIFSPKTANGRLGTVEAIDMTKGEAFVSVANTTKDAGQLPIRATVGHVVKVLSSNRSEDDYYLQWAVPDEAFGTYPNVEGAWEECTSPDEVYRLDPATMPHEIVRDGDNYTMQPIEYDDRQSGDDLSNPHPLFVGSQIQDIVSFSNRTLFAHDRQVSMSTTDEYNNWYNKTATASLDTDPINLRSTTTKGGSLLRHAVPFERDVVLFGDGGAQFVVDGSTRITPETASMTLASEFDADLEVKPVVAGNNMVFASFTGEFSNVHEMYLRGDQENHDRRNVSTHVPNYIIGQPTAMASADGSSSLFVVTQDRTVVYVWEYLWIDDRRVQNAWSKWTFDLDVVSLFEEAGQLYIVMQDDDKALYVSRMKLDRSADPDLDFEVNADYKQRITLADETAINEITPGLAENAMVVAITGPYAGQVLPLASATNDGTVATGDPHTLDVVLASAYTGDVYLCSNFVTRFVPTRPFIRDSDGVAVSSGALTISAFTITYEDTGPFTAIRESVYADTGEYWRLKHTGILVDDPAYTIGDVPISSGSLDFPFDDDTKASFLAIEADGPYPMSLTEIEWRGNRRSRSRRIPTGGR